jgi:phage gpG-like protein
MAGTLLDLASHLARAALTINHKVAHDAFEKASHILEVEIKSAIGTYKYGWPPIGPASVAKHGDTPLLDTGQFQGSITHIANQHEAWIGTNDQRGWWFEMGTRKMPPRPFLSPALALKAHEVVVCFSSPVFATILGK